MVSKIAHTTVKYMSFVAILFLTIISLVSTQRNGVEAMGEIANSAPIYNDADNLPLNLLSIFIMVGITLFLKKIHVQSSTRLVHILQCILIILGELVCIVLYLDSTRPPIGDQLQVYSAALYFNQGDYINLSPGGYVSMYPQQLGYISFIQLVFRLTRLDTYRILQLINCLFVGGILATMICLLNDVTKDNLFRLLGSIIIAFSLPLYLLHSWVYGDIAFLFFTFLFLHSFYKYQESHSIKHAILLTVYAVFMLSFRKNALLLLLASFIVHITCGIIEKNKHHFFLGTLIIVVPLICVASLTTYYQHKSEVNSLRGLPATCWIAMGMIEDASKPGWFNNYGTTTYYNNKCDYDATNTDALEKIAERIQYFSSHPADAASFWKRKICTQWNDPFFGTAELIISSETTAGPIATLLNEKMNILRGLLSTLQSFIYLGLLFYVLLCKHNSILTRLPEVMFLGGFLFSLLWEANSRYVYPYYLIIIPISILGWKQCIDALGRFRKDFRHEKDKY